MAFDPEEFTPGTNALIHEICEAGVEAPPWEPLYRQTCEFGPEIFTERMLTFIRNPNLNTSWLFRGDILYDDAPEVGETVDDKADGVERVDQFAADWPTRRCMAGMTRTRTMVRRLIPRNQLRDAPMNQTCEFHQTTAIEGHEAADKLSTLLLYVPHVQTAAAMPFYHPNVQAIATLHEWDPGAKQGAISIHFHPFPQDGPPLTDVKLRRVGYHMLERLNKHGSSALRGYTKRVHHDAVIPQPRFQDRYSVLKNKYARAIMRDWAEVTDPKKHVFEDLGIAAFLIELWAGMYTDEGSPFPGFVDIGCGNGLLVYILNQEGYPGWGFDARARKSWPQYSTTASPSLAGASPTGASLVERCLMPSVVPKPSDEVIVDEDRIHDGLFNKGTFIISNHADELTPWTPILAALSDCPFLSIPCCSHDLTGAKYRAPPPRDKSKPKSTYASLVDWVARIAEDCGWEVETEMLRIPSTRNTGLLGRRRTRTTEDVDVERVLAKYGGVAGYYSSIARLIKTGPRSH